MHFWLGSETSQDESGVAAYKTVELDNQLGGGPVQYRELQGSESDLFLSYFKNSGGIEYLAGGVDSGFVKVERDVYQTRLLRCKGSRTVRVTEVPLNKSSLNSGDVFILDAGLKLYVFNGKSSNKLEKVKGIEVITNINNDQRGGRAEIIRIDDDPKNNDFWGALGGYVDPETLPAGESDDTVPAKVPKRIFKLSDASGSTTFTEVELPSGKLERSLLDSNDVFVIDTGSKLYIWVGKGSTVNEKKEAMVNATRYLSQSGLAPNTPIERVSDGNESSSFKGEFALWTPPVSFGLTPKPSNSRPDEEVDVKALLALKQQEDTPADDGSGKVEVWGVSDFKLQPVDPAKYGQFHGGDSYVILYTYIKNKKENWIIYFWLGNESSADEKGAAALLAKELDDARGGAPVQVRVTQGKEPAHFRSIFKGRTIIHAGGKASSFANSKQADSFDADGVGLFHVRGTNALNTVAIQVAEKAEKLNSEDVFVLVNPSTVYVWQSTYGSNDEVSVATNVATILAGDYQGKGGRNVENIKEGSEPEEFWATLGGKTDYPSIAPGQSAPRDHRLFSLSTATGNFKVEEVHNFDQSDLNNEDVFLLDTYNTVFVWVGGLSSAAEKEKSMEFAIKYVNEADDGRDLDCPIIRVNAGSEPSMFTCYFIGWSEAVAAANKYDDPYEKKVAELKASQETKRSNLAKEEFVAKAPVASTTTAAPVAAKATDGSTHSLESLKSGCPAGVDPTCKETYLDDATFKSVFNTDKAAFAALPKWKRDEQKKKAGLF